MDTCLSGLGPRRARPRSAGGACPTLRDCKGSAKVDVPYLLPPPPRGIAIGADGIEGMGLGAALGGEAIGCDGRGRSPEGGLTTMSLS